MCSGFGGRGRGCLFSLAVGGDGIRESGFSTVVSRSGRLLIVVDLLRSCVSFTAGLMKQCLYDSTDLEHSVKQDKVWDRAV